MARRDVRVAYAYRWCDLRMGSFRLWKLFFFLDFFLGFFSWVFCLKGNWGLFDSDFDIDFEVLLAINRLGIGAAGGSGLVGIDYVFSTMYSRLFSTILDYSRLFSTILDYSRLFSTILDYSRLFSTILDYSWLFSRLFSTILDYSRLFSTLLDSSRLFFRLFSTILRLFSTIRDYSRLFATIRDYSRLFATMCCVGLDVGWGWMHLVLHLRGRCGAECNWGLFVLGKSGKSGKSARAQCI
jgi:hypothetical protein